MCQHLKKGKWQTPGGIKSVNLLLIPGLVVERLVLDTSTEEFKGNILHASQCRFVGNRFCQSNVLLLFDAIASFVNTGVSVTQSFL